MTKQQKSEQQEALARLREWINPGDTIYCQMKHVSRSGMQRVIQVMTIQNGEKEPQIGWVGYNVAKALGMRYDREREGVVIGGCGMDMGFAIVYDLSRALWPNGDRDRTPHHHKDGGYCLSHRWL